MAKLSEYDPLLMQNANKATVLVPVVDTVNKTMSLEQLLCEFKMQHNYIGELAVSEGAVKWYAPADFEITAIQAFVSVAPTGASVIFDVNLNGVTLFTTQANRPEIAASGFSSTTDLPDIVDVEAGDYITVDVDQVGSTIAGSHAYLVISGRYV